MVSGSPASAVVQASPITSWRNDRVERAVASALETVACPVDRSERVRPEPSGFFEAASSANLSTAPSSRPMETAAMPMASIP